MPRLDLPFVVFKTLEREGPERIALLVGFRNPASKIEKNQKFLLELFAWQSALCECDEGLRGLLASIRAAGGSAAGGTTCRSSPAPIG